MKKTSHAYGQFGEDMAIAYFQGKGFILRERNLLTPYGEIDSIFQKENLLVFVEVKYRFQIKMGYPREYLSARQIKRIRTGALYYIGQEAQKDTKNKPSLIETYDIRFDLIEIIGNNKTLEHISDAF